MVFGGDSFGAAAPCSQSLLQISHSLRQIALLRRENAEFEVGAAEARIQVHSDLQLRSCDRQLAIA